MGTHHSKCFPLNLQLNAFKKLIEGWCDVGIWFKLFDLHTQYCGDSVSTDLILRKLRFEIIHQLICNLLLSSCEGKQENKNQRIAKILKRKINKSSKPVSVGERLPNIISLHSKVNIDKCRMKGKKRKQKGTEKND